MSYVLVVDDKEENRYYLQALLSGHGYTVKVARHGAEALVLARQARPDLIVSDLLMPVMDGYTLLRHWKVDANLRAIPFIVYTATYTQAEDEKLALDLGADAFILKPAEPEVFIEQMSKVTRRDQARQPATESSATSLPGNDGVLRRYSETLIRKLEEKNLELEATNKTLAASEERFRLLAQATNDAVWDWDIVNDRRWWGGGFAELFGYDETQVPATRATWEALIHPEDRSRVVDQFDHVVQGDGEWSASYRLRRADGSWAQVADRGNLLRDERGRALRMVGGISDVSEKLALEERLRNAERLEAIGQLTGGIAHDFNNLLTVVLGNAECLVELLADQPDLKAFAQMISDAAERGADLTRRLLSFARKQSLKPAPTEINHLVGDLMPMLQRLLHRRIELSFEKPDAALFALVDPAQLENALLNLCVNARDAMPEQGTLVLQARQLSAEQAEAEAEVHFNADAVVALSVQDSGTGIAAEHLDKIFDPFFTTKPEGKGSGLGLAMVYGFARQSGGQVRVQSELGQGACFTLYLPATQPAQSITEPDVPTAAIGGDRHILLVDDDRPVRDLARAALESLGYRVSCADSGDTALALLQTPGEHFDLLLTDVQMTGMNGPELAQQALAIAPQLPILYTSGFTGNHTGDLPFSRWPVLSKPYRRHELAVAVARALEFESTPS